MKILIGIDDSPHSEAALNWVRQQSWPANTSVILASASPISNIALVELGSAGLHEQADQAQMQIHRQMVERAAVGFRGSGMTVMSRVEWGDPREVLVRLATAEKVDLVVVGSHGRGGLAQLLLGSVANHVVTHAPCSVVVVKGPGGGKGGGA
jgi:nucleotide-binding universal stress UspA family protein